MRLHAGDAFEIKLLNRSTLGNHITLPPEFDRIPYAVAASDVARIGLLAQHGGLYLDADFLVAQPLSQLLELLDTYETISYTSSPPRNDPSCSSGFAPNFVAARPRTLLWQRAWLRLREAFKNRCGTSRRHKVCCYAQHPSHPPYAPVPCRVKWALTDWVLQPVLRELHYEKRKPRLFCFSGNQSFTPSGDKMGCMGPFSVLTLRMSRTRKAARASSAALPSSSTQEQLGGCLNESLVTNLNPMVCKRDRGSDLLCSGMHYRTPRRIKDFFNRISYHLFESMHGPLYSSFASIEDADMVVSSLYRHALRGVKAALMPA